MILKIEEKEFLNYGRCVFLSNGILDVAVSIDIGPRILFLGFHGEKNVMFCDLKRDYIISRVKDSPAFYYYGGHRLWISPEPSEGFLPDNSPVVYSILPDSVSFLPPKQKGTEIKAGMEIILGEDASDIMIIHTAKNCAKAPRTFGLWPATMLKTGGTVILPQNTGGTEPLSPNREIAFWPGSDIRDPRVFFGNRFLTIRCEKDGSPLKIGVNNVLGWAAYVGKEYTVMKRFVHTSRAAYPDFGSSCEVAVQKDFTEIESLSPLYRVEPGDSIRHVENISLSRTKNSVDPLDENGIARYIENLS